MRWDDIPGNSNNPSLTEQRKKLLKGSQIFQFQPLGDFRLILFTFHMYIYIYIHTHVCEGYIYTYRYHIIYIYNLILYHIIYMEPCINVLDYGVGQWVVYMYNMSYLRHACQ